MGKGATASPAGDKVEVFELEHSTSVPHDVIEHNETEQKFTFGTFMALTGFQLGYFADIVLLNMVSAALPTINASIGPSSDYTWIVNVSTLTIGVTAPLAGNLSDIFGRRIFLLIGSLFVMLGCVIAATANNVNVLIGDNVFVGIGGGMHNLAWACLGELIPHKRRPIGFALFEMSLGPSCLSTLLAYQLITISSWRILFWFIFALNGLAFTLVLFFYHPIHQHSLEEGKTKWQHLASLDYIGLATFTSGLVLFLSGLSFGGTKYPWVSAPVLVPMVVGILLIIVCFIYESRTTSRYPLFPRVMFRDTRGFTIVLGAVSLGGALYFSSAILWPLQVQVLYATDPVTIGLYSAAFAGGGMMISPILGYGMEKIGHTRYYFTAIVAIMVLLSGLQATVSVTSQVGSTIIIALIGGFIAGNTVVAITMIQANVDHKYLGVASGLITTSRSVGGSIATVIYTTVLSNKLQTQVTERVVPALIGANVPLTSLQSVVLALTTGQGTSVFQTISPAALGAGIAALKESYVQSLRLVYLVSIAFGCLAMFCAAFTRDIDHLMTSKVDVSLSKGLHLHEKETDDEEKKGKGQLE